MKNFFKLLVVIIVTSTILSSCNNEPQDLAGITSSLKINLVSDNLTESTTKSTYYKKGEAPAYMSGITITADNQDYAEIANVTKTFDFNPAGEQASDLNIVLDGINLGSTKVIAQGICSSTAKNAIYTGLTRATSTELNARSEAYSKTLISKQAIWAEYSGQTNTNIIANPSSNKANLTMNTQNHRYSGVIENHSTSKYSLTFDVYEGTTKLLSHTSKIPAGQQVGFVINSSTAKSTKSYKVVVRCHTPSVNNIKEYTETISVSANNVKNSLFAFTKSGFFTSSSTFNITWVAPNYTYVGNDLK